MKRDRTVRLHLAAPEGGPICGEGRWGRASRRTTTDPDRVTCAKCKYAMSLRSRFREERLGVRE